MKKFSVVILSACLLLTLTACDKETKSTDSNITDTTGTNIDSVISVENKSDTANENFVSNSNPSSSTSNNNTSQPTKNNPSKNKTQATSKTTVTNKGTTLPTDVTDDVVPTQNQITDVTEEFKPITDSGFSEGNGTQTNPYMITTAEELVYFSEKINTGEMNTGVHFALGADIDMTGVEFSPIGNSAHRFSSYFDGRGFTISNLTPKLIYEHFGYNANYICGFFGMVENAEIKNLCLENVNITYTYESNYFTEIGILAACVYPTRECKITDCIVNGTIKVETDILLAGGIVGDIFVTNNAKLNFERLQSNTKIQVRSESPNVGAVSGSLLGRGQERFSDICAQSVILHSSTYRSYVGAFGGVSKPNGSMSVSNCFFKINTNKNFDDQVHPLIGGIIGSYQSGGTFYFTNVFGFADDCNELYEISSENPVKEENCSFTNVLPEGCNFNTEIWDITDPVTPFIKFNLHKN